MLISALLFSIAYALKGGQFKIATGRILSIALSFAIPFFLSSNFVYSIIIMISWCVGVFPSMGEEAGAIGRWKYAWGRYIEKGFGRSYGVKKGIQRGCWLGSCFALATGNILCIPILTLAFVFGHFIGQEIYYRIHGNDNWKYAEPIIGAFIGFCVQL